MAWCRLTPFHASHVDGQDAPAPVGRPVHGVKQDR
jgi:hypothetical protein